jgi:hypothetical protein
MSARFHVPFPKFPTEFECGTLSRIEYIYDRASDGLIQGDAPIQDPISNTLAQIMAIATGLSRWVDPTAIRVDRYTLTAVQQYSQASRDTSSSV